MNRLPNPSPDHLAGDDSHHGSHDIDRFPLSAVELELADALLAAPASHTAAADLLAVSLSAQRAMTAVAHVWASKR